jgi:hypothetical protein
MAVPNIFANVTTSIPLSQLDTNFATAITLGNTAVYLGNTTTTLGNLTLTNVTLSSGTSNLASTSISNGTSNVSVVSSGGNVVISTNGATAVTVDTGQRTKFPTTIGVGAATPSTSGIGITFPATENLSTNANTLDDYEEGTYTPAINQFTVSGTTTLTGSYTKIGNIVSFNITFANTGTIAHDVSANITVPFSGGKINTGAINMWINGNGYPFNSNQSGTQLNTAETSFGRFFVGSFTTTSAGQQLLFAGTYRLD